MKEKNNLLPELLILTDKILENKLEDLNNELRGYHLNSCELDFILYAGKLNELKNKRNKEINELMRKIKVLENTLTNIGELLSWEKELK